MTFIIATFYHFFDFADFEARRAELRALFAEKNITGSLLLAREGFNATIAGGRKDVDFTLGYLRDNIVHGAFEGKESIAEKQPFKRGKVRLKKETIGLGEAFSMDARGDYVDAKDWNALIADPDTILLDTRNLYETHLGTFAGAVDPKTRTFKQLPDFVRKHFGHAKEKKIATFCTGGIRCEKATAWLKAEGFTKVYHLKGGILKYLEEIPPEQSLWQGECFVFDQRVAVGHGLKPSQTASVCYHCGQTLTCEDRAHPSYSLESGCPYCEKNMAEKHEMLTYGAAQAI